MELIQQEILIQTEIWDLEEMEEVQMGKIGQMETRTEEEDFLVGKEIITEKI